MNNTVILQFLIELRKRLLNCVVVMLLLFSILIFFANDLYTVLAKPLLKQLPSGHELIAINVVAPFFVPFELAFFVTLFLTIPFLLYHIWKFIAPALYQKEKRVVWLLLVMSSTLFYVGMAFAYFVIFPIMFNFLTHSAPKGVLISPDMSAYLDFALKLLFIFGAIFEVPVVTILLVVSGVVTQNQLIKMRPYAIVSAFILGMFLAPPDVLSQTLLAVPLWLLFECGIFLSTFFIKKNVSKKISSDI